MQFKPIAELTESGRKPWECVSHCGNYMLGIFFPQVNFCSLMKEILFWEKEKIIGSKVVFHLRS